MTSAIDRERQILSDKATSLRLPKNFILGAATAAYQIEGAPTAGGKSESIWDRFCRKPGVIIDKSSGDVACDHYHRWPEDIALMRQLKLDAYRFSLAWTRIQPSGSGPASAEGIAFYDRLIDGLLAAGITPFVTGTCRRPSRTRAAGTTGTRHSAWPTMPTSPRAPLATG